MLVQAYYAPNAARKNLVVLTKSHAARIVFSPGSSHDPGLKPLGWLRDMFSPTLPSEGQQLHRAPLWQLHLADQKRTPTVEPMTHMEKNFSTIPVVRCVLLSLAVYSAFLHTTGFCSSLEILTLQPARPIRLSSL